MAKILLVEDDETIVRTLKDFLHTEGFVVENTDGQKKCMNVRIAEAVRIKKSVVQKQKETVLFE